MKVLLAIDDDKARSLMEVLKSLPYVETTELKNEKAQLLTELWEATEEMREIKAGNKETRNAEDFLDEL